MAYFTGPNSADCTPPRKSATSSSSMLRRTKPAAPSAMTPSSIRTVMLIRRDFSYLSASWPAVAENRKNGNTNRPCATFCSTSVDIVVKLAV